MGHTCMSPTLAAGIPIIRLLIQDEKAGPLSFVTVR